MPLILLHFLISHSISLVLGLAAVRANENKPLSCNYAVHLLLSGQPHVSLSK